MDAYQKRVVEEKKELGEKLEKLDSFLITPLAKTLPAIDLELLVKQRNVMLDYSILLSARMQRW